MPAFMESLWKADDLALFCLVLGTFVVWGGIAWRPLLGLAKVTLGLGALAFACLSIYGLFYNIDIWKPLLASTAFANLAAVLTKNPD